MSRHQIISPAEIKRRVAEGEPVVIYEGYVLHLGEWIDMHPGGRLSILHMVGRDATDEINMFVIPHAPRLALVYVYVVKSATECVAESLRTWLSKHLKLTPRQLPHQ
jgi:cytochrome b involved in lipid metabolism